jgi:predicted nucleic acid-binding protein
VIAPDASVVIAALAPWHSAHACARNELMRDERMLPAHVAFEVVSVLSRMPEDRRLAPSVVLESLENDYPEPWLVLAGDEHLACLRRATVAGVRGGMLYDALIAATAKRHGATLLSADRRASAAYEAIGANVSFVDS